MIKGLKLNIDWLTLLVITPLLAAGLTVIGLGRQVIWIIVGILFFLLFSQFDWRFLNTSGVLLVLYLFSLVFLLLLFFGGETIKGSTGWFDFFFFSVDPADPSALILILILAKYFSRRHIEIANFKHILISGVYAAMPTILIFFQPDFGSALVFVLLWLGMIMVSGVSKKHLLLVFGVMFLVFAVSWMFVLKPYQKDRILTFLDPLKDPRGSGYNALQSMIAAGSGQIWGKGFGYGTQSRLLFLPEYKTDFVFAAFAEEWGFIGVSIIFFFFGFLIWRLLKISYYSQGNFEKLFGIGLTIFLMTHFVLHVGMNVGLLPITGLPMPFLSYGGSNLITIFAGLGVLVGMGKYSRKTPQADSLDFLMK